MEGVKYVQMYLYHGIRSEAAKIDLKGTFLKTWKVREKSHCDISKKNIILGQDSSNVSHCSPIEPFCKICDKPEELIHSTKSSFNIRSKFAFALSMFVLI